ncbi:MAG: TPM domain-containing protein, partial [Bacteroidales bacterium]|nr:TPM domain-containing protein [Bacteroidales bacterium]
MKTIKIILTFLFFSVISSISAQTIQIPELNSPVTDLVGILSESEINFLENKLIVFEKDSIGQIAILIIPTTGDETIEEYSIRLAEKWEIGSSQNDNGLILLVAKEDRTLRIE